MEVETRLMVTGKDALADEAGIIGGAFGEKDDDLAKLLVRTPGDQKRLVEMRSELTFELLGLDLQAARADDVVAAAENAEFDS